MQCDLPVEYSIPHAGEQKGTGLVLGNTGEIWKNKGASVFKEAGDGLGVEMKQWKGIKIASGT